MGGASSYYSMLFIAAFLAATWAASKVSKLIGVSSIVAEIGVGIVLGPEVLNFLPTEYSECYHDRVMKCDERKDQEKIARSGTGGYKYCDLEAYLKKGKYADDIKQGFWGDVPDVTLGGVTHELQKPGGRRLGGDAKGETEYDNYEECLEKQCELKEKTECAKTPDIFTLIGHAGVALMIFESGMHFDFEQAKIVGKWAAVVAVLGTMLPLVAGLGLTMAYGYDFENGFAVGTALAPTSVGIALKLLHEAKCLNTNFGQAIITAAFLDDILSLLLYNVLFSIQDEMTFMTFLPMGLGIIFMIVAAIIAATLCPKLIAWSLSKIPEKRSEEKLTTHHEVIFVMMIVVLVAYAQITHLCGTHLWGCFLAGMSFAQWKEAHHIWVRQTKRITVWMVRIFFAASVAFAIPINDLFSLDAIWKGSLMGIGPCIATKVFCAVFMGEARWVIGWAMVGRAEFAYLIAQMAAASNMMSEEVFSIVIWALLWATVFAPFIFRFVLNRYVRKLAARADEENGEPRPTTESNNSPPGIAAEAGL